MVLLLDRLQQFDDGELHAAFLRLLVHPYQLVEPVDDESADVYSGLETPESLLHVAPPGQGDVPMGLFRLLYISFHHEEVNQGLDALLVGGLDALL